MSGCMRLVSVMVCAGVVSWCHLQESAGAGIPEQSHALCRYSSLSRLHALSFFPTHTEQVHSSSAWHYHSLADSSNAMLLCCHGPLVCHGGAHRALLPQVAFRNHTVKSATGARARPLQVGHVSSALHQLVSCAGADMLSLITCAAKQAGEPSTHDLLRMSNVSPQEIAKWKAPNAIAMVP